MTGPIREWRYDVELSDAGWVWLPGPEESVAAWAQGVEEELAAESAVAVELGEQLRSFAGALLRRRPDLGALWVPDPVRGVLATLRTDRYKLTSPLELIETVRHLVAPPRCVDSDGDLTAVELTMTWARLQGDAFADLADHAARLLRITVG